MSKADYLVTDKTITVEQLEKLGIDKKNIFDTRGNQITVEGELQGSFRIITHDDKKLTTRGLMQVDGTKVKIKEGWIDGIYIDGNRVQNALLTNKEGRLLSSSFFNPLNPDLFKEKNQAKSFEVKNKEWLQIEFLESLLDTNKNYVYKDENKNPCGVELLTVFSLTDGDSNLNLETQVNLINPALRIDDLKFEFSQEDKYWLYRQIKPQPNKANLENLIHLPTTNKKFLEKDSTQEKIMDLYLLIEQIKLNVKDLSVTSELLKLHNPEGVYTKEYFDELSKSFSDVSKFSWYEVDRENNRIDSYKLDYKDFCRAYLQFIQGNSELRKKYYWLADRTFSGEKDFTYNEITLLQLLDDAMIDMFGYVGYILLQAGMLNFGEDNLGRFSSFGYLSNIKELSDILTEFGISCLDGTNLDQKDNGAVLRSLLAFGFKRTVKTADGTTKSYTMHPPSSIIAEIFNGFKQYNTDFAYFDAVNKLIDPLMPNLNYLNKEFLDSFLSDTETLKKFLKLPTNIQIAISDLGMTLEQLRLISTPNCKRLELPRYFRSYAKFDLDPR